MFCPPVNRLMKVLDRSFFRKSIALSAAQVLNRKEIARLQKELSQDILHLERLATVRLLPGKEGAKGLLLKPEIKAENASTWSQRLRELVDAEQVTLTPYTLDLDYDYWNYHEIMSAILPEDQQDELPTGYSIIGQIAHLNLREYYLPYKKLIATVILDKNPAIRTVINKIDEVGTESEYRTFRYELLAGDSDMNVEVKVENCFFRFDYSRVYWNPRLNTEHRRLINLFRPGEAVCDVMAGVGPFAVPAGKKNVFVWANDLNPDSYTSLQDAIRRNKVSKFVRAFNEDGHNFIRSVTQDLLQTTTLVSLPPLKPPKSLTPLTSPPPPTVPKTLIAPRTFSHYIMNLPATALFFLPAFRGLYAGHERLFAPYTSTQLPWVHVYCFSLKTTQNEKAAVEDAKVRREVAKQLGLGAEVVGEGKEDGPWGEEEVQVWDVRDVAPLKRMVCASFQLPPEAAFATDGE